jgi:hypothetical protein
VTKLSDYDISVLNECPSGIYAISQKDDYRCYIGSAVNVQARLRQHFRLLRRGTHHSPKLQNVFSKHGIDAFEVFLIEPVADKQYLTDREQFWINLHNSSSWNGYNCCPTAGSTLGRKVSPNTREKIRAANLGKKLSPEIIEKIRAGNLGKKRSPEAIAKSAASRRGKKHSPEARASMRAAQNRYETLIKKREAVKGDRNPNFGKKASHETRAKLSNAHRGRRHSSDSIEKIRQAHTGKIVSEDTRKKLSANTSARRPDVKEKLSDAAQRRHIRKLLRYDKVWGDH